MAPLHVVLNYDGSAVCGIMMVATLSKVSLAARCVAQRPWIIMTIVYEIMMAPLRVEL